jgi:hypothetical protein
MAEFLNELASGAGVEDHEAHHGMGAVLAHLKSRLSPEAFAHLKNAIPDCEHMLSAFQKKAGSTGGSLLDSLKGMAGKLWGPQDSGAPQDQNALAGLSTEKLRNLLRQLHDMLAAKLPPHVLDQIKQYVPGFQPAAERSRAE